MPGAGFWGCCHAGSREVELFGDQPAELLIKKIKSGRILYHTASDWKRAGV